MSAAALLVLLAWAVVRPWGWPEAAAAVPAATVVVATGALTPHAALAEAQRLAPVIGFLAAVLVLAQLCDDEGLFRACGAWMARASGGRRPGIAAQRLLVQVFAVAAVTTAVLSLDATVVLLTPVVFVTAARLGVRPKPHVYACTHLANSASLLLPVSNLTNLLAFAASGLAFPRFAALMTLPWLAAIAVEYLVFRRFFAAELAAGAPEPSALDLSAPDPSAPEPSVPESTRVPVFTVVIVAGTLAGFVATSLAGINPAWAACAGATVLGVRALARRRTTPVAIGRAAAVPFLLFVLCLGIVVRAVVAGGLGSALAPLVPHGISLPALLLTAALAAVLANLVNNLPAVLLMLPLAVPAGPGAVLGCAAWREYRA